MTIIHSDRLQLSVDVFTNIFLIFGFLTAFYQFYIIKMERSSIEGQIGDAIDGMVSQPAVSADVKKYLKGMQPQLTTLNKLFQGDTDATTLNNKGLFTVAWMITVIFAVLVTTLGVSFFGYRKNPYFKKHPLSIADILFKNFWMFVIAGGVEFVFFMKIATKFVPVPPSALGNTVANAIKAEFDVPIDPDACPQRDLRAANGEKCSNIWICATKKNEIIAGVVMGVVLLVTILAITLQPLAFPFLFTMQPNTLAGVEMDQFADLSAPATAEVLTSTVLGGKTPPSDQALRAQAGVLARILRQQRQHDAGAGFAF
jgi:hypothetical protein